MNKERALEILATLDGCCLDDEADRERVALALAADVTTGDLMEQRLRALTTAVRKSWKETKRHQPDHMANVGLEMHAAERVLDKMPHVRVREYTCESDDTFRGETCEFHESFGVAQFNRTSGSRRLFNTALDMHPGHIRLTVHRAQRHRAKYDNARVWKARGFGDHHTHLNRHLVDVAFSYAQFAELISNMNSGEGVACTIQDVNGIAMDPVPDEVQHEHEEIIQDIRAALKGFKAGDYSERAAAILGKKSINKGDRIELARIVKAAADHMTDSLPFYLHRFEEGVSKVSVAMKAEIEGVLTSAVQKLGIKALQDGGAATLANALAPGDD